MRIFYCTALCLFSIVSSFAQQKHFISTFFSAQANLTLRDASKPNNPWSVGLGTQTYLGKGKLKPTVEISADVYLADNKVFKAFGPTDGPIERVDKMINVFGGFSFVPDSTFIISILGGPSFINGNTLVGIKPSLGYVFSKSRRWMGRIAYINVFNRYTFGVRGNGYLYIHDDFGSISFSIAYRLL